MRARGWFGGILIATLSAAPAQAGGDLTPAPLTLAEASTFPPYDDGTPNPTPTVDVLTDATGGTYVVIHSGDQSARAFYGTGKKLYELAVSSMSTRGTGPSAAWELVSYAPRLAERQLASLEKKADGGYVKACRPYDPDVSLSLLLGEQAKQQLAKVKLYQQGLPYAPFRLARDDRGVYYFIDQLKSQYGGKGYRLFVGKRGAMKRITLTDYTIDSAGAVFNSKAGDLRFVISTTTTYNGGSMAESHSTYEWVRGEKHTALVNLDVVDNLPLVYSDLGVYTFIGGLCDNPSPKPITR